MDTNTTFLIVGAGTFGLSTAWHLLEKGYTQITVMDRWAPPSPASAGDDISKIVRTEYTNPIYTKLAHESLKAWETLEPFASANVFHKTGWIVAMRSDSSPSDKEAFTRVVQYTRQHGDGSGIVDLPDAAAIREFAPQMTGEMQGWYGIYNSNAGWVEARRAMHILAIALRDRGVTFIDGQQGAMKEAVYDPNSEALIGIKSEDGTLHAADKIILATGAWSESLFDFEGQLISGTYARAHLQLSPEETTRYSVLPVVDIFDCGYFFPSTSDGIFKTCKSGPVLTNLVDNWRGRCGQTSVPRDPGLHPDDTQPIENQRACVDILRECIPELAEREVVWSKLCHDTESVDSGFIISSHPSAPSKLYIATAGSGHAFKNFPILGKYVVQCLEGALSREHKEAWRWRPDIVGTERDLNWSSGVKVVDLKDVHGWQHGAPGAP